jgi:hypothetical protein
LSVGAVVLGLVSGPQRNKVPAMTAPQAKIAADHQNAVV